jgi:hypothetical protein
MKKEPEAPGDRPTGARDSSAERTTIRKLNTLLSFWVRQRDEPFTALLLENEEYHALFIAAKREFHLRLTPQEVEHFLSFPGWLQRWVMESSGWTRKGKRLG